MEQVPEPGVVTDMPGILPTYPGVLRAALRRVRLHRLAELNLWLQRWCTGVGRKIQGWGPLFGSPGGGRVAGMLSTHGVRLQTVAGHVSDAVFFPGTVTTAGILFVSWRCGEDEPRGMLKGGPKQGEKFAQTSKRRAAWNEAYSTGVWRAENMAPVAVVACR